MKILNVLRTNWIAILIVILVGIVFLINKPKKDNIDIFDIEANIKKSIETIANNNDSIKKSELKIDSLVTLENSVAVNIEKLNDEVAKKQKAINLLNSEEKKIKDIIKKYKTSDISEQFKNRYKIVNGVSTVPYGVVLMDTVGKLVLGDLISNDINKKKLKITNQIVNQKDSIIVSKDSIIDLKSKNIIEHTIIISNHKSSLVEKDVINESITKKLNNEKVINKKEKNKNKLLYGVIIVLTIFGLAK